MKQQFIRSISIKTVLITLLLLIIIKFNCKGQDTLLLAQVDTNNYVELSTSLGYNYSPEKSKKKFHLIEIRIQRQNFGYGRHGGFSSLSSGFDIGINTSSFLIGPRAGVILGFGGICVGTDLAYYTDFKNGTLRLIPMMGFGSDRFRITVNPHVILTNKNYEPINRGHFNLTIKMFKLKKRIIY